MATHNIDLSALVPHDQTVTSIEDGMLGMRMMRTLPRLGRGLPLVAYLTASGRYRLPLRIDLTVKIDSPGLYLMLGKGRIGIGTHGMEWCGVDDICDPLHKNVQFDNRVELDELADITVVYDRKEMQILINGEERFYSKKERYMKSPLLTQMNEEGFELKLACDKRVDAKIKSLSITEYDGSAGIIHGEIPPLLKPFVNHIAEGEKPTVINCAARLPAAIRDEVIELDEWIRKLRPMKFRRTIEKHGNKISYVASDYGFSYALHVTDGLLYHTLQWYIVMNGPGETWLRKADGMEKTLEYIAETDPDFTRRMFDNLEDCNGCYQGCLAKSPYTFEGKKKVSCHGKLRFKMTASEFADARRFIGAVNELAESILKKTDFGEDNADKNKEEPI